MSVAGTREIKNVESQKYLPIKFVWDMTEDEIAVTRDIPLGSVTGISTVGGILTGLAVGLTVASQLHKILPLDKMLFVPFKVHFDRYSYNLGNSTTITFTAAVLAGSLANVLAARTLHDLGTKVFNFFFGSKEEVTYQDMTTKPTTTCNRLI